MATTSSSETTFTVRRLTVAVPDVRGFQRSYEAAVPEVPHAMLSAPLRTVIWEDSSGGAWFTVDQPSTQSGSVGLPEVWTSPGRCSRADRSTTGLRQRSGAAAQAVHQQVEQAITLARLDGGE